MHHKVIIIDKRIVVTGSYNFSSNARTRNDENTLILHSSEIAEIYVEEFDRVWEIAEN
jgi:phosphatidylserine/phosphatidylglycerophosphate/cardiolipin synthase-like enzyme